MNDAFTWLTHWLADVLLLGSALLLAAHAAFWLVKHPAQRMTLAWGTLLGLLTLMILVALPLWPRQSLLPSQHDASNLAVSDRAADIVPEVSAADSSVVQMSAAPLVVSAAPLDVSPLPPGEIAAVARLQPGPPALLIGLLRLWLCGAALALGWIVLGAWQAARLLRRSQESPAWTQQELAQIVAKRRPPGLLVSPRVATAVALGASRPQILLPANSVQPENVTGVRAALAHEWAHIRHGDLWLLALERLLLPVFFWHPLFWLFRRRVRFDQELLADAAAAGEHPVEYAEALLAWAKSAVALPARPPWGMAALSLWENPRSLTRRVEMILQADHAKPASASRPWRFFVFTSLLASVLGLSLVTLRPTATAQDEVGQAESKPRKAASSNKKKKNKPSREETRANPTDDASARGMIQLSMHVLEVDPRKLDEADVSWGEFLEETSDNHCRHVDGVIVADYDSRRIDAMLARLKEGGLAEALSNPRALTVDNQEATIQIGSEVPLVEIQEIAGDESKSHVEHRIAGLLMSIRPRLSDDARHVELNVAIERSKLLPASKDPTADRALPVFKTQRLRVATDVVLGETVVLAEREPKQPKKDANAERGLLLVVISPQLVFHRPQPQMTANDPAVHQAQAVEEQGQRVQSALRRGLEWLQKHAATDEAAALEEEQPLGTATLSLLVQSLRRHDGDQLADELEREVQALRLRRLELEAANYRDGVDLLHKENDQLRKQVAQLQQKLLDAQVQLAWLRDAATAAGREKVSDEAFLRRVYLDLTGVPPTAEEAKAFLNEKDAEKRSKLIDRLLPSALSRTFREATWKNLVQQRAAGTEPAANPLNPTAEGDQRVVKVFALKYTSAQRVIDVVKQLQEEGRTNIELHAIAQDPRTNSIIVSGNQEELVVIGSVIAALDKGASPPAEKPKDTPDELAQRLQALDVREAEINLRAAQAKLERVQMLAKTSPNALPQQEVLAAQFEAEKAALVLESIKSGGDPLVKQKYEVRLAEVRLRSAQARLERLPILVKEGGAPLTELEAIKYEVEKSEVELERAKARLTANEGKTPAP